jgi:hypothetical protein
MHTSNAGMLLSMLLNPKPAHLQATQQMPASHHWRSTASAASLSLLPCFMLQTASHYIGHKPQPTA